MIPGSLDRLRNYIELVYEMLPASTVCLPPVYTVTSDRLSKVKRCKLEIYFIIWV